MDAADKDRLREAAKEGKGSELQEASSYLKSDASFVLELIALDPESYKYAAEDLKQSREFALQAVKANGMSLRYMSGAFKADKEITTTAKNSDNQAAAYAHPARRAELGVRLPWDPEDVLIPKALLESRAEAVPPVSNGPRVVGAPLYQNGAKRYRTTKLQKTVQFSALSTMTANMGQGNYIAANTFLDKLPFYQRPEVDAVTLMWGAVGNIGMRWKAFASMDFLNATPEALLSINDAAKILHVTCSRMETPEWYAASFFDEMSRHGILMHTHGVHNDKKTGWKPGEDALSWTGESPEAEERRRRMGPDAPKKTAPLGGWPDLAKGTRDDRPGMAIEMVEGTRVRLTGLKSKNGLVGTLIQGFSDGKWKVRLDDGSGNALLRENYLEAIAPPSADVVLGSQWKKLEDPVDMARRAADAAAQRREKIAERRAKLKEEFATRKAAEQEKLLASIRG